VIAICRNGDAQVRPAYSVTDAIEFGRYALPVRVKEPTTLDEIAGYHKLEDYHYRGKALHGRRVPLIVQSSDPLVPGVLGYIELSTSFMMSRPRAELFNAPFAFDNIRWKSWKKTAVRQYTNVVVRIARCVVSPEFRGLSLAQLLVRHAAKFARRHWNVGGFKPLFLEITADMLRYVPFVEHAGMHYIGDTEGNLRRVRKDMEYILRNLARVKKREILKEESAGIVDLQVYYATQLAKIAAERKVSHSKIIDLLLQSPERLSDIDWDSLHTVLRQPKPTFIMGLYPQVEAFVEKRIKELGIPTKYPANTPTLVKKPDGPIRVRDCTASFSSSLIRTRATRRIQESFGVSKDMLTTTLFSELSFEIRPGDLVLLCGPSGAGKTTLLRLLFNIVGQRKSAKVHLAGEIHAPSGNHSAAMLQPLSDQRPLVNSLGTRSLDDALFALNVSGLAEPHLYVKRFNDLSNGQRYRAMVAKLIASKASYWFADEFCATLDPITSNIVSRNLRRCAKRVGATTVLAAANWSCFIDELRPDKVIHLRSPWDAKAFSWPEFKSAIRDSDIFKLR
jgi:ABC-type ATPase with predicted acetyltransferase domain